VSLVQRPLLEDVVLAAQSLTKICKKYPDLLHPRIDQPMRYYWFEIGQSYTWPHWTTRIEYHGGHMTWCKHKCIHQQEDRA
jgi:hypothetical protein